MATKLMTMDELRKKDAKALNKELLTVQKELANLRLHVKAGENKQSHKVTELKRYIARILTVKNELQHAN